MPTLTGPTSLYALAETAVTNLVNGAAYSVPTNAIRADVEVFIALVQTTALLSPPNSIVIQTCNDATDDSQWVDSVPFSTNTTAAATTTMNGSNSAGATTITLTGSATFSARSGFIYLRDSATAGEWVNGSQATTTLTVPSPGVSGTHATSINCYDQAVKYIASLDVSCVKRIRLKVDNNVGATGPTLAVTARITTYAA